MNGPRLADSNPATPVRRRASKEVRALARMRFLAAKTLFAIQGSSRHIAPVLLGIFVVESRFAQKDLIPRCA